MTKDLLAGVWNTLDSTELRLLLWARIGGPGQYDGRSQNKLYLPLADNACRLVLHYRDQKIIKIEQGPAFDATEWKCLRTEIDTLTLVGPFKAGRDCSFSSFRVQGHWRGERSGIQILQPPIDAPQPPYESAEHPFVLEFPLTVCGLPSITNHRRIREHRKLTFLLNVLLVGRTNLQPRRPEHFWAGISEGDEPISIKWVQQFYFANIGEVVTDQVSPFVGDPLDEVAPEEYYTRVHHDGKSLRVPADLDDSLCRYFQLPQSNRIKFDRATYWMDMASRQWAISMSSSFASLVSAIESLTERGTIHRVYCEDCKDFSQHDMPGPTEKFRAFFEHYAPGVALRSRRSQMYSLRSRILHGNGLMHLDQEHTFGWDPPWRNERELHNELWALTRIALRNWLKNPPTND